MERVAEGVAITPRGHNIVPGGTGHVCHRNCLGYTAKKFVILIVFCIFSDCFVIMSWETVDGNTQEFVAEVDHDISRPTSFARMFQYYTAADFLHG